MDRVYSLITGRLQAVASGRGSTTDVQNILYAYDSLGNITSREDTSLGRKENFQYDGLNRLKRSDVNGASAIDLTYDALGNIKTKSNAGTYVYGGTRPHAVSSISGGAFGNRSFTYDANGNLTEDGQRSLTWTSYDQVKTITKSGRKTEFWFGAGHERVMQVDAGGSTTTYVGALLEIVKTGTLTEQKHYIYTPGGRVAVRTTRTDGSAATSYETRFLHQDAQGSVTTVTTEYGAVEQRFAFDPWGQRVQTVNNRTKTGGAVTRGYTDHEHLDAFGIIHMNGRVYDPVLSRFLSADPIVQAPGDAQSYNRYSYCINNPVNLTDPSGYSWSSLKKTLVGELVGGMLGMYPGVGALMGLTDCGTRPWMADGLYYTNRKQYVQYAPQVAGIVVCAVVSYFTCGTLGGAAGGFVSGYSGSLLNGSSLGEAFMAGAAGACQGAILGAVSQGIGEAIGPIGSQGTWGEIGRAAAHGTAGGVISEFNGGDFKSAFCASAFASLAGSYSQNMGLGRSGDWSRPELVAARTAVAATVGGTVSAIGGGKFANGAWTAAFQHLCNAELHNFTGRRETEVFHLNDENAVKGAGHSGSLVGIGGGKYVYISYGPSSDWLTAGDNLVVKVYDSFDAAWTDIKKLGYTRYAHWSVEQTQANTAVQQVREFQNKDYQFVGRNCLWIAQAVLQSADLAFLKAPAYLNRVPNKYYEYITERGLAENYGKIK